MRLNYSSLQKELKLPGAGGTYSVHIWGKPPEKIQKYPGEIVSIQRNELLDFYKRSNIQLQTLTQTHGNRVLREYINQEIQEPEADSFFTTKDSYAMTVKTADCIPILFYNTKLPVFGAIHSGWRGLHNDIVSETLDNLKKSYLDKFEDFFFIVGPHIHTQNYETSEEVYSKFKPAYSVPGETISKKYLNMEAILRDKFKSWNIPDNQLTWINDNTYNSEKYFSHRSRDTGRNFNVIFYSKGSK